MSSSTNICMLSRTPVREGDKVKLYFLVSEGVYGTPLFRGELFYAWDAFKVLGALSVDAVCVEHGRYKIEVNKKSDYILSLLRGVLKQSLLSFDDVFDRLNDDNSPICLDHIKNKDYLRFSVIHEDIYHTMVKEKIDFISTQIKEKFSRCQELIAEKLNSYVKSKEFNQLNEKEKEYAKKKYKAENWNFNFGYMESYVYQLIVGDYGFNVFSDLMRLFDLDEFKVLDLLIEDMTMLYIVQECGILLSPSPAISLHYYRDLNLCLARLSLEKLLSIQQEELNYSIVNYDIKYDINITQSISFQKLENSLRNNIEKIKQLKSLLEDKSFYELGFALFSQEEIEGSELLTDILDNTSMTLRVYLE